MPATHADTVLSVLRHASDIACMRAWNAAEDAFVEPTNPALKERARALADEADAAESRYQSARAAA